MAFVYNLCSSSKGNCTYIGDPENGILIDAGIGPRNFTSLMRLRGISPNAVKGIFITHEHSDHISGLKKLCSLIGDVPVFATRETLGELLMKNAVLESTPLYEINKRSKFVAGFEITAFDTPHDSVHSVGYSVITPNSRKICVCTDLGTATPLVQSNLDGSDFVLLESNYDDFMLLSGGYPEHLKYRIMSNTGHLSNSDAAKEIKRLIDGGTKKFLLGHLSEENNKPQLALESSISYLSEFGLVISGDYSLGVAPKKSIGKIVEV